MQEINIEQIMEEIRNEIREKGYQENALSFEDIPIENANKSVPVEKLAVSDLNAINELLQTVNQRVRVDFYKPITDGGIKGLVKRVIRKMMKPLLFPLCVEQEAYNVGNIQLWVAMCQYMQKQEQKINQLETELRTKEK